MLQKVDESKLKDLIESAGKINQSVYTDETVNTLNQAKEEAEETIQGKPNQEEVEDSYLNLVNAIQSLQQKIMIFNVMFRFYKMETR